MKVFLDTNVLLDYLCGREQRGHVERILIAAADAAHRFYISPSSFYTITYYTEVELKNMRLPRKERIERLRQYMRSLLEILYVTGVTKQQLLAGVDDAAFLDLEDSYQHQAALGEGCTALVTINTKDFRQVDRSIELLTPAEFVEKYL